MPGKRTGCMTVAREGSLKGQTPGLHQRADGSEDDAMHS